MMTVTPTIVPEEVIFPLKTIEFEGFQLKAPNDTHKFLTVQFGDYMLFPRGGVEHHSAGGLDQRGDRAEKSGTDMDEVLEKLKDMDRLDSLEQSCSMIEKTSSSGLMLRGG